MKRFTTEPLIGQAEIIKTDFGYRLKANGYTTKFYGSNDVSEINKSGEIILSHYSSNRGPTTYLVAPSNVTK